MTCPKLVINKSVLQKPPIIIASPAVSAVQLMTAMIVDSGFILYQKETSDKTNEIPVMQSMLENMDIKGSVITADAMH